MLITMCKSKIHRARITGKNLNYSGSIGIDKALLKASKILPNEKVQVVNLNNGARFETYCIEEKAGSGGIVLYGPAARLGEIDDIVIIICYGAMERPEAEKLRPRIVRVDKNNRPKKD